MRRACQLSVVRTCEWIVSFQAQLIAQSISQAFQVAYMEFLKANGINDPNLMKEMDYQDVLSQQAIFGEELFLFSNKDMQKEVEQSIPHYFGSISVACLLPLLFLCFFYCGIFCHLSCLCAARVYIYIS